MSLLHLCTAHWDKTIGDCDTCIRCLPSFTLRFLCPFSQGTLSLYLVLSNLLTPAPFTHAEVEVLPRSINQIPHSLDSNQFKGMHMTQARQIRILFESAETFGKEAFSFTVFCLERQFNPSGGGCFYSYEKKNLLRMWSKWMKVELRGWKKTAFSSHCFPAKIQSDLKWVYSFEVPS